MSVKMKIKVTKDVLRESSTCKMQDLQDNCAIAVAIHDLFPQARVNGSRISIKGSSVYLPAKARNFIHRFDQSTTYERINMPEIEFQISIPDRVLSRINIDEIKRVLEGSETLQLVNQ